MKAVIYQMLPRLFGNINPNCVANGSLEENGSGKLNQINDDVIASIKGLGATHIWYTGVLEHATAAADDPHVVKGKAGSPYAIKDYYDIDPDLVEEDGKGLEEWQALIDRTHKAGLKVVMDFVPNHTARRYHSDKAPAAIGDFGAADDTSVYFSAHNNYYYIPRQLFSPHGVDLGTYHEFPAKVTGNDCLTAFPGPCDWYDTVKLNYGLDLGNWTTHYDPVPDTWHRMVHILRYWAQRGADAFRCDMVHMVPLEFWRWAIPGVRADNPHVEFIGELYDVGLYRPFIEAGFDYLYDKVNTYDRLRSVMCSDVSAAQLTGCWQTVEGISSHMLHFLENHDEQRIGSPQFAGDPMRGRAAMAVAALMHTGPVMIYMGQELGELGNEEEGFSGRDGRTTLFDYWSLASLRRWLSPDGRPDNKRLSPQQRSLRSFYARLLNICRTEKSVTEGGFFDLMYVNYDNPRFNPHRHYAFLRASGGEALLVVANFGAQCADVEVNIPRHAFDTLGLDEPTNPVKVTNLLSGARRTIPFTSSAPVAVHLEAYGAAALKISL